MQMKDYYTFIFCGILFSIIAYLDARLREFIIVSAFLFIIGFAMWIRADYQKLQNQKVKTKKRRMKK